MLIFTEIISSLDATTNIASIYVSAYQVPDQFDLYINTDWDYCPYLTDEITKA